MTLLATSTRTPRPGQNSSRRRSRAHMDLQVLTPGSELGPLATHPHWDAMYDEVARLHRRASHDAGLRAEPANRGARRDQSAEAARHRRGHGASWQPRARGAPRRRAAPQARRAEGDRRHRVARTRHRRGRGRARLPGRYAQIDLGRDPARRTLRAQPRRDAQGTLLRDDHSTTCSNAAPRCARFAADISTKWKFRRDASMLRRSKSSRSPPRKTKSPKPSCCAYCAAPTTSAISTPTRLRHLLEQLSAELPDRIMGAAPKIFFDRVNARVRPRRVARACRRSPRAERFPKRATTTS